MPITHKGSKVLETARVILRPFVIADTNAMFKYASDPETTRFMRFSPHKSVQETAELLTIWEEEAKKPTFYNWAVVCKDCNEVIGSIGMVDVNEYHSQADVGYIIRKDHWGKGIMTECLRRVIQYCVEELNFNRLEACHAVENPASGRVMKKAGMKEEGVKRQYFPTDHGYIDTVMYAITRSDYLGYNCLLTNTHTLVTN